jgi:hypothetical protein
MSSAELIDLFVSEFRRAECLGDLMDSSTAHTPVIPSRALQVLAFQHGPEHTLVSF